MSSNSIKTRENRLRRLLTRQGLRLEKTPARSWQRHCHPVGYMIMRGSLVVEGGSSRQWEATLEQAENFAAART